MKLRFAVLGVLAVLLIAAPGWSADHALTGFLDEINGKASLKGLTAIQVRVGLAQEPSDKDLLVENTLLTKIELCLRKAGINVVDSLGANANGATLYLQVTKQSTDDSIGLASPLYFVHLELQCSQFVLICRPERSIALATTWQKGLNHIVGVSRLSVIYDDAVNLSEQFANDYLAANPVVPKSSATESKQADPFAELEALSKSVPKTAKSAKAKSGTTSKKKPK